MGGAALVALLLTGCAADVDGELRRGVADLTDAANASDADGVRDSAASLIARAQEAVRDNDISPEEGGRIIELATLLRDRAGALEPAEPLPTAEPTATRPEPSQEPVETQPPPSPSPSPPPEPTQAPPSPSAEPSAPTPDVTVLPEG